MPCDRRSTFLHSKPVNEVRRAFGLPRLSHDVRRVYTAGELVLYPDVPEFVPLQSPPNHHHFVGVCPWAVGIERPTWWADVMAAPQRKVFVTLGTSGPLKALPAVLDALSTLPVTVIVTTSGRSVGPFGANVYVADLLPYKEAARGCAVVISHGGTGGLYPALSAGTPMLAIPSNIDNHLSAVLLERSGAGLEVRVEDAIPSRLRSAVNRLLGEPSFKTAATSWASLLAEHDTARIFPSVLKAWFAG